MNKNILDKNFRLRWIFYLYIIVILLFAALYQKIYQYNDKSFVFAENIYQTKIEKQSQEYDELLKELKLHKVCLDSLSLRLKGTNRAPDSSYLALGQRIFIYNTNNRRIFFQINELNANVENQHSVDILNIKRKEPSIVSEKFYTLKIVFPYDSIDVISRLTNKRLIQINNEILTSKKSQIAKWEYLDFLYFSTITQATVGYGDMLPNSTIIRFIVTIQTLIGVFMTVILIAYSFEKIIKSSNASS